VGSAIYYLLVLRLGADCPGRINVLLAYLCRPSGRLFLFDSSNIIENCFKFDLSAALEIHFVPLRLLQIASILLDRIRLSEVR